MKHIVEAVEGDIFWSSGISPQYVSTTKPEYYPGANQLGNILEAIRFDLVREAVLFEDIDYNMHPDFPPPSPIHVQMPEDDVTLQPVPGVSGITADVSRWMELINHFHSCDKSKP